MTDNANITLARRLYDSKGDPAVAAEVLAPDIIWDVTPGFPLGGVYNGFETVGRDFFGQVAQLWASFYAQGEQFFADDEDHVFVLGHYHATTQDGRVVTPRFIHLWTVRDGQLAHLQQAADSYVARQALEGGGFRGADTCEPTRGAEGRSSRTKPHQPGEALHMGGAALRPGLRLPRRGSSQDGEPVL